MSRSMVINESSHVEIDCCSSRSKGLDRLLYIHNSSRAQREESQTIAQMLHRCAGCKDWTHLSGYIATIWPVPFVVAVYHGGDHSGQLDSSPLILTYDEIVEHLRSAS